MVEVRGAARPKTRTATAPRATTPTPADNAWLNLIAHSAEGVLFHMSERDLFTVLKLKGFQKLHDHQVEDESENLEDFKEKYIKAEGKVPYFDVPGGNKWADKVNVHSDMEEEQVVEVVKKSMADYADWERGTLDMLLKAKANSEDRKKIYEMTLDVMKELKYIEDINECLEDHGYTYEAVCEMSEYLCNKY